MMLTAVPSSLQSLVDAESSRLASAGIDATEAEQRAWRSAAHAGWYQTQDGWKRLGPDLRKKINVRKAERQPDGSYLIRDVDVFYPNAVKEIDGDTMQYTVRDIEAIIDNTNRAIAAGGQRPGITKMHPSPYQKSMGVVLPIYGTAINFRPSDRGDGWARCDLVDVSPEIINDWKQRKITGLSAGIVQDAHGLNRRFGHVAALGAEAQALSMLPTVEIFSAHSHHLCFSADADSLQKGVHTMDTNRAKKLHFHFAAIAAAYAACAAGEPGADAKVNEAKANYTAEFGAEAEMPPVPAAGVASPAAPTPEMPAEDPAGTTQQMPDFAADPQAAFEALVDRVSKGDVERRKLRLENLALRGAIARDNFSAQLKTLSEEGYTFDANVAMQQFEASAGNAAATANILKMIRSTPKRTAPSQQPTVFGATDAGKAGDKVDAEAIARELSMTMGRTFSAEDVKLGAMIGGQ